jgi:hypothetical protein
LSSVVFFSNLKVFVERFFQKLEGLPKLVEGLKRGKIIGSLLGPPLGDVETDNPIPPLTKNNL